MGSLGACATPISPKSLRAAAPVSQSDQGGDGSGLAPHLTHYCITRRDISPGLQAANLIHAAGESSPGNLAKGTYAVALTAANERDLWDLAATLESRGIPHTRVVETDGAHAGQLMAIGIVPCDRDRVRRLLSHLPLLRCSDCERMEKRMSA